MKHQNHETISKFIRKEILEEASKQHLTNEAVAEKLGITSRNYSNFKSGKYGCSAETMCSYIVNICSNRDKFLDRLEQAVKDAESKL